MGNNLQRTVRLLTHHSLRNQHQAIIVGAHDQHVDIAGRCACQRLPAIDPVVNNQQLVRRSLYRWAYDRWRHPNLTEVVDRLGASIGDRNFGVQRLRTRANCPVKELSRFESKHASTDQA